MQYVSMDYMRSDPPLLDPNLILVCDKEGLIEIVLSGYFILNSNYPYEICVGKYKEISVYCHTSRFNISYIKLVYEGEEQYDIIKNMERNIKK